MSEETKCDKFNKLSVIDYMDSYAYKQWEEISFYLQKYQPIL